MYKIISDGTPTGTRVFDEDWNEVYGVKSVVFHHTAGANPTVWLEIVPGALDAEVSEKSSEIEDE